MGKTDNIASGSLCPAMASADLIGDKWTLLILREMLLGTTRFNRFQRALPRMSPSILSKRLKMLESAEIIVRKAAPAGQTFEYRLTRSGRELGPIIEGMAVWGLRWRSRSIVAQDYDVGGFMWDFHRTLKPQGLPGGQIVILVQISDRADLNKWWLIVNDNTIDLCTDDPGHAVDIYITAPLTDLIDIWMGDVKIQTAIDDQRIFLDGPLSLVNTAADWFSQSPMIDIRPVERSSV